MIKKLFALLFTLTVFCSILPVSYASGANDEDAAAFGAYTANDGRVHSGMHKMFELTDAQRNVHFIDNNLHTYDDMTVSEASAGSVTDFAKLLDTFRTATESLCDEIDVFEYRIKESEIDDVYMMLVYCSPRSYYLLSVSGYFRYDYEVAPEDGGDNYVKTVYPFYEFFRNEDYNLYNDRFQMDYAVRDNLLKELTADEAYFDSCIDEIKNQADEDDSDYEKLIKYHDYIVMNYKYDWEYNNPDSAISDHPHSAYHLLLSGYGVCDAFSALFNYLMLDLNLPTAFITSYYPDESPAHTWNMVQLTTPETGGTPQWFNIDVTWDLAMTERLGDKNEGTTSYEFFLTSDYETWLTHSADSTYEPSGRASFNTLDHADWKEAVSPVVIYDGKYYYIVREGGADYLRVLDNNNAKDILRIDSSNPYTGLVLHNDNLYYNDESHLYEYNIKANAVTSRTAVYSGQPIRSCYGYREPDNDFYIRYCTSDDNHMYAAKYNDGQQLNTNIKIETPSLAENKITGTIYSDFARRFFIAAKTGDSPVFADTTPVKTGYISYEIPVDDVNTSRVFIWDEYMRPLLTY